MAHVESRLNWDVVEEQFDEDADDLNDDYEWMFIKLNLPIAGGEQEWDSPGKEFMDRRGKDCTFRPSGTLGFVSSGLSDTEEYVEVEPEEDSNEEDRLNGEATEMYNVIHIDEKWFYRSRGSHNYYLAPGEEDPYRSTQSKNFIEKVMFLAGVARPRFAADGTVTFDGKLGIWPFTYKELAKRKSKNRAAGTMVTKVLPAVTQDVSRTYMINFLLPAIRARWPAAERGMPIFIQHDNAKTHIPVNDPEFVAAAQAEGWDIRLRCQPPNSPDLNILDLSFFAALQSFFHKLSPGSVKTLY